VRTRRSTLAERTAMTTRSDLAELVTAWRTEAQQKLKASKAYKCRSMDGERSGLVKGAAALMRAADQVQAVLDADADVPLEPHGNAVEAKAE